MKPAWWMAGASIASWLAVTRLLGIHADLEIVLGMAGPLAAAIGTWVLVERTYTSHPERLTPLMITAFAVKMVFFGAYVTVMLRGLSLRPIEFVSSFTGYFIALHVIEAQCMRRLFARGIQ